MELNLETMESVSGTTVLNYYNYNYLGKNNLQDLKVFIDYQNKAITHANNQIINVWSNYGKFPTD